MEAEAFSLLGRLERFGPGAAATHNRRLQVAEIDRQWCKQQLAYMFPKKQGWGFTEVVLLKLTKSINF